MRCLGIVLVSVLLVVPVVAAERPQGTLYATADRQSTRDTIACGTEPVYALSETPAGNGSAVKAYLSRSYQQLGCTSTFTFNASVPFQLEGTATLEFVVGCDVGSYIEEIEFRMFRNDIAIRTSDWPDGDTTCGPGEEIAANVTLFTEDTFFEARDALHLDVVLWADNLEADIHGNVYLDASRTWLSAPGLLVPPNADTRTGVQIEGSVTPSRQEIPPNGTASYAVQVTNTGDATAEVETAVSATGRWEARMDPPTAEVEPGQTREFSLLLSPPRDGTASRVAEADLVVTAGSARLDFTVRATIGSEAPPAEQEQDADPAAGKATPGPGTITVAAALAAAWAVLGRRR